MNKIYWFPTVAGLWVLFIGLGLCRFSYTPLIPDLINQGWVNQAQAGYLGAINYLGYLLGALLAKRISHIYPTPKLIRLSLILAIISLGLCAINISFSWLSIWRWLAGLVGAFFMVLTPSFIVKDIPVTYQGRAVGIIFTGIGLSIMISGFAFPPLAKLHIALAWLAMSLLALIGALIAWRTFQPTSKYSNGSVIKASSIIHSTQSRNLTLTAISYILFGIACVPYLLFLADYIHRQLHISSLASGIFWSLFGIGALIGPFSFGWLADKIGNYKSLFVIYFFSFLGGAMMIGHQINILYAISCFCMGAFLFGILTLTSLRTHEFVGGELHSLYWGKMTLYYAISQAGSAYLMSFLLHRGVSYTTCFSMAALLLLLAAFITFFTKQKKSLLGP